MQIKKSPSIDLTLDRDWVAPLFSAILACLAIVHIVVQLAIIHLGFNHGTLIRLLDMGEESSLATIVVLSQWLSCVILLGLIVLHQRRERLFYRYWLGLLVCFTYLTMDEFLSVHEAISRYRIHEPAVGLSEEILESHTSEDDVDFSNEDAAAVHRGLDRLKAPQREVLTLFFLEKMSYKDIAQVLDINLGTVRSRLYHAKQSLRRELEKNHG